MSSPAPTRAPELGHADTSHYRLDFPDRDDERFLKTSVARYEAGAGTHDITFEPVDTTLVQPRARTYGRVAADEKKTETSSKEAVASS